jgi:fatty-acyl-CoA synthase
VESVARTVSGVYKRRCAAFADGDPARERIVLVAETNLVREEDRTRLKRELGEAVRGALGLDELDVYLLKPRAIPRTTSGKLQRLATRRMVGPTNQ